MESFPKLHNGRKTFGEVAHDQGDEKKLDLKIRNPKMSNSRTKAFAVYHEQISELLTMDRGARKIGLQRPWIVSLRHPFDRMACKHLWRVCGHKYQYIDIDSEASIKSC